MEQTPMVHAKRVSDVTSVVANHPRVVFAVAFLVVALCFQGTVSAETVTLVEPTAGHGASTGP
ncbi:hypothetical protein SAMN04487948_104399 [Halogranum amylolyticum]|uniref:Uncharacterized protein n=1 Tax=Halogranum amylolyticum TaxID=660520 RepID=A0A1H8S2J8_9EURY|nr:hypothetical protein [Halogranum amylolyticum]SEO72802.1 hypothetical protein SAMN04487948_104399 [Halogranum amylolyticum]